jgi:hypothetical protein
MKTYQIELPDELAAFVDAVLAQEKWDDAGQLFLYALAQVQDELAADADLNSEKLRKAVQVGIDQADRGELNDGEATISRLRARLEAARKQPT